MAKRLVLQRAYRFYTMHQFVLKEINRRITAKQSLVNSTKDSLSAHFHEKEKEFDAKLILATARLAKSEKEKEELRLQVQKLMMEAEAMKSTLGGSGGAASGVGEVMIKGDLVQEVTQLQAELQKAQLELEIAQKVIQEEKLASGSDKNNEA